MAEASTGQARPKIWWSNALFFLSIHAAAFVGIYYYPFWAVKRASLVLAFLVWQLADFGITIGYHRLYSHKAFKANTVVRAVLALLGSAGFQGAYDIVFIMYAATKGLFYSHMGWIFYKPVYERMGLVDQDDLNRDPVVRFQHKYYVPIALTLGFAFPPLVGLTWKDPMGSFIWAGLVSRLFIWHCTFLVNSLAHADGLQPYSDEDTSRGNLAVKGIITTSGPSKLDWDPSKWIILTLHRLGLIHGLRRAKEDDIADAVEYMRQKHEPNQPQILSDDSDEGYQEKSMNAQDLAVYRQNKPASCLLVLDGFVLDVTSYLGEHPGGAAILREYSVRADGHQKNPKEVQWAFFGGLNIHSRSARRVMRSMRIARFSDS
ncbi:hypothetical protein D9611_005581 [Ephemerocybe angulata]|uniref:Cytochrome b5 heme-binding domain-containing protein n=1 Tax=Ephemerocybe angulata TaxID=980116 RepID=A0A8H5BHT9_9AGAR|nr:hypothetical protein D9611_005581 [Tulosesus angulatus]